MKIFVVASFLAYLTAADKTPCRVANTNNVLSEGSNLILNGATTFFGVNTERCVFYELYTNHHNDPVTIVDADDLKGTNFDPTKLNMFVVHGWRQSRNTEMINNIAPAVLINHDVNVFIVDWSAFSVNFYTFSRNDVRIVGARIADFINEIQDAYNLTGSSFLLVGYSLGSHVVGHAGSYIKSRVDRIVALDASGPQFVLEPKDRLNPSHAEYVEVIHTDAGRWGLEAAIGHADYFPNGGLSQNGCLTVPLPLEDIFGHCEHTRSLQYFTESLITESKFEAIQCGNYEDFLRGACQNNTRSLMGGLIKTERPYGSFYLETGRKPPYAVIDAETKATSVETKIRDYQKKEKLAGIFLNRLTQIGTTLVKILNSIKELL